MRTYWSMERRRGSLAALFSCLAVASLAACGGGAGNSSNDTQSFSMAEETPWTVSYAVESLAMDKLRSNGYEVTTKEFDSPETLTQAVSTGEVDMGFTSAGTILSAVNAGAPIKAFMGLNKPDYVMVARKDLTSCASLDGRRVAIHSREGTTGTLTLAWLQSTCPDAKPQIKIVPGSENRVAALIANQIDASAIDLLSARRLLSQYPDRFGVIDGFGTPGLVAAYFFAATDYLDSHAATVRAFVGTYGKTLDGLAGDTTPALDLATSKLPDMDKALLKQVVGEWVQKDIWIPREAVQPEAAKATLSFYQKSDTYENVSGPDDFVTDKYFAAKS